jgi:transposase InsO family protein
MPWKEQTVMSQREKFCELASQEGANISELCRHFEISRPTGYKWLGRNQKGETLENQSRRPILSPNQTVKEIEDLVLEVREKHPAWGGRKIKAFLEAKGHLNLPSPSTMTAIFKRYGKVDPQESIKHKPMQRFEKEKPNQLWQMDFKGHFDLGDGYECHPLTVLDDHSRFLLGLRVCPNEQNITVQKALTGVFREYGLPDRMLMDNGSPWGDDYITRHTIFTAWLIRLGVLVSHGRPRHPQTQGKDERIHRTLIEEVLAITYLPDSLACQNEFDDWRYIYNYERPHESLGMKTPSSRYQSSSKPFPETLPPIIYDTDCWIRKVDQYGKISFQGRTIRVGRAFGGHPVGIQPTDTDGVFDIYFCSQVVANIDLTQ